MCCALGGAAIMPVAGVLPIGAGGIDRPPCMAVGCMVLSGPNGVCCTPTCRIGGCICIGIDGADMP